MRDILAVTVIAANGSNFPVPIPIVVIAGLVVAVILAVGAFFLFRSSGKGKKAGNAATQGGAAGWDRQGQPGAGTPGAWNQAGPGSMDNAWNQPQQQQPSWNAPNAAPNPWDTQGPSQQPAGWGAPNSGQQVGGWGTPGPSQQQAGSWGSQGSEQQAGWGAQQSGGWGTPSPGQQSAVGWGNQNQPTQKPAWDVTANSKDPWGQPQAVPQAQQQSASTWNAQGSPAASPQPPQTAYGGVGSGQSWGQPAQTTDPWGAPSSPQQQGGRPQSFQPQQGAVPSTPSTGNANAPAWQTQGPNQGYGQNQGQQGFSAGVYGADDGERTVLRSNTGPQGQGRLGIVRIAEGKEPGREYEVRKDSLSIGRSRESDIFLEDLAVSRLHASIVNMGNGSYALRDEGSANGTKVNGQTVTKYQPYPLQEGDKIQLGQTVLVFSKR